MVKTNKLVGVSFVILTAFIVSACDHDDFFAGSRNLPVETHTSSPEPARGGGGGGGY